ncbi:MAG: exosortase C-terminal domain/associated protein EpsI [candidate division KSB1 bacterium]
MQHASEHSAWKREARHGIPLSLLIVGFFALFFPALRELVRDWTIDPNYEHGVLVPVIVAYLLWQKRNELRGLALQPAFGAGLALCLFGFMLFIIATAGAEWFVARSAMLLSLYGLVLYFAGWHFFKRLSLPLLYLGFMIPLPYVIYYRITFPLQQIASTGAFRALKLLGLAGQQEGNILHFSGFSLEVIEACSGLRSMMVLVTLAALIAYMTSVPNLWRWLLFLSAAPVAIVANIFRLMILALLGIFVSPEAAMSFLHEGSGILVFLIGLFLLMILAGALKWGVRASRKMSSDLRREGTILNPHSKGEYDKSQLGDGASGNQISAHRSLHFSPRYWIIIGMMTLAFAASGWVRAPKPLVEEKVELPRLAPELVGWHREEPQLSARAAEQLKADQILLYNYSDARGRRVEFFLGYYRDQQFGAQVHSPLHCLPGAGWTILRNDKLPLPFEKISGVASKLDISKKNEQQYVVYWFVSEGEIVKNEMDLKIRLLRNALRRRGTSVYFYRVCVAYQENDSQAGALLLHDFLQALGPRLSEI